MSDDIGRAQAREEEMRQDALAEQSRRAHAEAGDSALTCAMCEAPIPEARRLAVPGVTTCVDCQTAKEASGRWDWGMSE